MPLHRLESGLLIPEEAAPSTPATGLVALTAKADGLLYSKNDQGHEQCLSAGAEIGYSEIVSTFNTTNTGFGSTAGNITGMSVGPIAGQGRPVAIEFYAAAVGHSVNSFIYATLMINDSYVGGQFASKLDPNLDETHLFLRRLVLASGTNYTFKVSIAGGAAGTSTVVAGADWPAFLAVTQR